MGSLSVQQFCGKSPLESEKILRAPSSAMDILQIDIDLVRSAAEALHEYYPSVGSWTTAKRLACLLCFPDRYGASGVKLHKDMKYIFNIIKSRQQDLRKRFSARSHYERVQCQRPVSGPSLLTITSPRDTKFSKKLSALLILIQHPETGLEGFRVKNLNSIPFSLHKKLQPSLPTPETPTKPCVKLNKVLKRVFQALYSGGDTESQAFIKVNRASIDLLELPPWQEDMEYISFVPEVQPGKQLIFWKTWHSTGGSDAETAKITSFLDLVPASFLSQEQFYWYKFVAENAPCDTGAGSSRGSWCCFVAAHRRGRKTFGCPYAGSENWVQKKEGSSGFLTREQHMKFDQEGYLVVDIPDELQRKCNANEIERDLSNWFAHVADVVDFSFHEKIIELTSTGESDDFLYYTDRLNQEDPMNPDLFNPERRKSRNAQAGGKLIPNDSGMGPGSTYCDSPLHLDFQFDQWTTNLFSSFYGEQTPLLRMLCRFRIKMTASWDNTHVDIDVKTFLPQATDLDP